LDPLVDILNTYYKCTLSAIFHKLNTSGHMLIWTVFPVLVCGTRAQSLSALLRYTLYMRGSLFVSLSEVEVINHQYDSNSEMIDDF
jgi:hypothetical protein